MRLINRCRILFATVVLLAVFASSLEAAIIVSFQGNTISAGGTGFVDVFVSSNAAPGTPDNLDLFQLQFRISPLGGGALEFTNPQSESHLGLPGYVLAGDSFGDLNQPISTVSNFLGTNDQLDALDATVSFNGVDLSTATGQRLLFRFDLNAAGAAVGDQFQIALIDGISQFSNSNGNPYVTTPTALLTGGPLELDAASFTPFTITAVPEPATGGLLAIAGCGFWIRRRWKSSGPQRRNAEPSQHCPG